MQSKFIAIFDFMKPPFFFLLLCLPLGLSAQFTDDFSDGDFTSDPPWFGNTDRFVVAAGELQLLHAEPEANNTAFLAVDAPTTADAPTTWSFRVRLEFSPSSANRTRIYLSSTAGDLSDDTNGYFVEIGESGSDDALTLYRQDGSSTTALVTGAAGAVANDPAEAGVRVTRSTAGEWELSADYSGGTDYQLEGTATDDTYPVGQFFGFYCRYSATRADKFFFDDVFIDPLFVDTQPPELISATALSATGLLLTFNEPLDPAAAEDTGNYTIDNGIGAPVAATFDPAEPARVSLTLNTPLVNLTTYTLTATGITDANGNAGSEQTTTFTFLDIQPAVLNDIIITEIMADPTPAVGLPETEYVELYNRSEKVIQLGDLLFDSGGSPAPLSSFAMPPQTYVILTDSDDAPALAPFGEVVSIDGSLGLTNGGDQLQLTDSEGERIHQINYTDDWYADPDRDDGGYALELIDLAGPYDCAGNWRAAVAQAGGTPGGPNSVQGAPADDQGPVLTRTTTLSDTEIVLLFDEPVDEASATDPAFYDLAGGPAVMEVLLTGEADQVLLILESPLQLRTVYTLTVPGGIADCLGNTGGQAIQVTIALGEPVESGDLLVTEIMADPGDAPDLPEVEYIELYNRSEKFLQLGGVAFSNGGTPKTLPAAILLPGEYLILTDEDAADELLPFGAVLGISSFPALVNSGDEIILLAETGAALFSLEYDTRWYADPEKARGGNSLEMIDRQGPLTCRHNWRAADDPRGGTPGQVNSIDGQAPESVPVDLQVILPEASDQLLVTFNRALDPATALENAAYTLEPELPVTGLTLAGPEQVRLTLGEPLAPQTLYTLTVNLPLTDCVGNGPGAFNTLPFGLPEPAAPGDFAVNEVLFFPQVSGSDFVELYNRSGKVINLNGLEIENAAKLSGNTLEQVFSDFLLLPQQYAVLTPDPADIQARYQTGSPVTFLATDLPTLDSDEGNVTLRFDGVTIDSFDYSDDLHFSLLDNERGVSLERIDPAGPSNSAGNWHSAASTVGFATPGYQNSVFALTPGAAGSVVSVPNNTFSPDGDGFEETLNIFYDVPAPGYVLNVEVFDAQGRPVRKLLDNQTLAGAGSFKWDGATDDGQKARIGIYVLWIELFRPDGSTEQRKETCVLAGRLD